MLLLIPIILLIILMMVTYFNADTTRHYVNSEVDNRLYLVRKGMGSQQSADMLARLNKKMTIFIKKLGDDIGAEYGGGSGSSSNGSGSDVIGVIKRLTKRYNPNGLTEGILDPKYTAYTTNKGESVTFCLRTRDASDSLYDENLLFGVALHELGHIASVTQQHNSEFHKNFAFLIQKAIKYRMFLPITKPVDYCGIKTVIM